MPHAMTKDDIKRCIGEFAAAAKRVDRIGYDVIELHGGHGYLLHQFMSPLSNQRTDEYGGSTENRIRFALEVYKAVRAVWPEQKPLGIRVSATDWVDGGWTPEETVVLAKELKKLGCDYMDVSTGGLDPKQKIPLAPGYQVPFAEKVKRRPDRRLSAGRGHRRIWQRGSGLPCARRHVGSALGLARRRGTRRRDALCAEDHAEPSEDAAAIVPEAGAGGRLRRIGASRSPSAPQNTSRACARGEELRRRSRHSRGSGGSGLIEVLI
jgi:hypothetical protein